MTDDPSSGNSDRPAATAPSSGAVTPVLGDGDGDGDGDGAGGADDHASGLVDAVDALADVSTEPLNAHAARYHEVHSLLQDALSATDRPGS